MRVIQLLEDFKNKGATYYTQHKASKIKAELKELLLEAEYWQLSIAHSHYQIGEGRQELDDVCNNLIKKYS